MILMIEYKKGDLVEVTMTFVAPNENMMYESDISLESLAYFVGPEGEFTITSGRVTTPERAWFFGDLVTLEDHPSGGFSFVDSDSTNTNLYTNEEINRALNPGNRTFVQYGPYRLVALHGRNLGVRGE